ncbi:MAG: hypothetical protein PSV36_03360 [Algoriphagus sp.]|nr:hypothetical protein [Algoriphagus sp.]
MKKLNQILQIVLLVYFGAFLIFFLGFRSLGGLFGMEEITADAMITIFLLGAIIFLINWVASSMTVKGLNEQMNKREIEMNGLKAKLYDFEHPKTTQAPISVPRTSKPGESPDQSNIAKRQNITE